MSVTERELLRKVRKIEIKAKRLSQQVFAGQYHSAFRGHGMTFSEVRSYQLGDDVRDIDWNVTARHASPYIKIFEEERELALTLLVDLTASTLFGTQAVSKREFMCELVAVLAFSALQNHDKVGAIFFTDRVERFIPAGSGRKHLLYILRELLEIQPQGRATDLSVPLGYLMKTVKKRSTAFLISDFMQPAEGYSRTLDMVSRKHELIGLRVFDPSEQSLPKLGLLQLEDSETGELRWVDTSSASLRHGYEANYQRQVAESTQACLRAKADLLHLSTDSDYALELMKLFKRRI